MVGTSVKRVASDDPMTPSKKHAAQPPETSQSVDTIVVVNSSDQKQEPSAVSEPLITNVEQPTPPPTMLQPQIDHFPMVGTALSEPLSQHSSDALVPFLASGAIPGATNSREINPVEHPVVRRQQICFPNTNGNGQFTTIASKYLETMITSE